MQLKVGEPPHYTSKCKSTRGSSWRWSHDTRVYITWLTTGQGSRREIAEAKRPGFVAKA